jgi:hypothetical protein
MFFRNTRSLCPGSFEILNQSFGQSGEGPFGAVLPEAEIERAFRDADAMFGEDEDAAYTPAITLWGFLSQTIFEGGNRSCVAAVARIAALCVALSRNVPSGDTGAYCRARAKLQPSVLSRLALRVAERAEEEVGEDLLWHGRRVKLADGSTVSMPDTKANQAQWPQSSSQLPGLGFPIVRMVFLISLVTGMVCDMALGPYAGKQTGEMALMRQLLRSLGADEILLADRYYCTFFLAAMLLAEGRDFVVQLHHAPHVGGLAQCRGQHPRIQKREITAAVVQERECTIHRPPELEAALVAHGQLQCGAAQIPGFHCQARKQQAGRRQPGAGERGLIRPGTSHAQQGNQCDEQISTQCKMHGCASARNRSGFENGAHHAKVGVSIERCLGLEHQPMRQHPTGHGLHVVGSDELTATQAGVHACGAL